MSSNLYSFLKRMLSSGQVEEFVSARKREERALLVAARRFSRGNTNLQDGRIITESAFAEQMTAYSEKVARNRFAFLR